LSRVTRGPERVEIQDQRVFPVEPRPVVEFDAELAEAEDGVPTGVIGARDRFIPLRSSLLLPAIRISIPREIP